MRANLNKALFIITLIMLSSCISRIFVRVQNNTGEDVRIVEVTESPYSDDDTTGREYYKKHTRGETWEVLLNDETKLVIREWYDIPRDSISRYSIYTGISSYNFWKEDTVFQKSAFMPIRIDFVSGKDTVTFNKEEYAEILNKAWKKQVSKMDPKEKKVKGGYFFIWEIENIHRLKE